MANRYFNQFVKSFTRELVTLHGQISINSSGAVTACTIKGASAAKTATGTYTITLEDTYNACMAVIATMEAATAVDLVPQVVSDDVVSAKTIVIKTLTGATATTPSAACKMNVIIFLRNSSVV